MICDKCGKSNIQGLSNCAYCSAEMPKTSGSSGFSDILKYKQSVSVAPQVQASPDIRETIKTGGGSEEDMQKLIKKSDNILNSTRKNSFFTIIAIVLSALILLTSVVLGVATIASVERYKNETMEQIEMLYDKLGGQEGEGAAETSEVDEKATTDTPEVDEKATTDTPRVDNKEAAKTLELDEETEEKVETKA